MDDGCAPDLFALRANRGELVSWATDKIPAILNERATIGEAKDPQERSSDGMLRVCFEPFRKPSTIPIIKQTGNPLERLLKNSELSELATMSEQSGQNLFAQLTKVRATLLYVLT